MRNGVNKDRNARDITLEERQDILQPRKRFFKKIMYKIPKLIQTISDVLRAEKRIFNTVSFGEAIIFFGTGFPKELPVTTNVAQWLILGNMTLGTGFGIHKMYRPDNQNVFSDIFEAIAAGCNAGVFLLQTQLAIILLDYNKKTIDVRDSLFYAGILPLSTIVALATTIVTLTKYKPVTPNSQEDWYKFISFLTLQTFNAGSTVHTSLQYLMSIINNPLSTYRMQYEHYLAAAGFGLACQIPLVADVLPPRFQENNIVQLLGEDRWPRQSINFLLDVASSFNNAVFWIILLIKTQPDNENSSGAAAQYDFKVLFPLLLIMTPVLAKLLDVSIMQLLYSLSQCCSTIKAVMNCGNDPDVEAAMPLMQMNNAGPNHHIQAQSTRNIAARSAAALLSQDGGSAHASTSKHLPAANTSRTEFTGQAQGHAVTHAQKAEKMGMFKLKNSDNSHSNTGSQHALKSHKHTYSW